MKFFQSGTAGPFSRILMIALAATLVAACDDGPTAPKLGVIRISTLTTGGDFDTDGYQIVLDSVPSFHIASNAAVVVGRLPAGTHAVSLQGVADNCIVAGTRSLSIMVAGDTAQAAFSVECAETGVEITTRVTGDDYPAAFEVRVGGMLIDPMPPNGTVRLTRLTPGSHTVSVRSGVRNCSVSGDSSTTVEVTNRAVTSLTFDIACLRVSDRIAFVLDSASYGNGQSTWIAMTAVSVPNITPLEVGYDPSWSPDGSTVAFSTYECVPDYYYYYYYTNCSGGVRLLDVTSRVTRNLSDGSTGPSWSPDGTALAYTQSSGTQDGPSALHLLWLDGSRAPVTLMTPGVTKVRHPAWSPDSRRIAFGCVFEAGATGICVINADGTGFQQLSSNSTQYTNPAWSPDGSRIAFATAAPGQVEGKIATMSPTGTDVIELTTGFDPAWSPHGLKLIFARYDGLFIANADGSNVMRVTTGPHRAPVWRP